MIRFKIDVLQELKNRGYNTNRIRQEHLISESSLQQIRTGKMPGVKTINVLCALLHKQPGQLLEYIPDSNPVEVQELKQD